MVLGNMVFDAASDIYFENTLSYIVEVFDSLTLDTKVVRGRSKLGQLAIVQRLQNRKSKFTLSAKIG